MPEVRSSASQRALVRAWTALMPLPQLVCRRACSGSGGADSPEWAETKTWSAV